MFEFLAALEVIGVILAVVAVCAAVFVAIKFAQGFNH